MKWLTHTFHFDDNALQIRADMYICVLHFADNTNRIKPLSLIVFDKEDEMSYYCYRNQHLSLPVGEFHYISMGNNILSIFISHPFLPFRFLLPTSPISILTPNCVMLEQQIKFCLCQSSRSGGDWILWLTPASDVATKPCFTERLLLHHQDSDVRFY